MDKCPKCGATSGDSWSQCRGECPMPGSPHYRGAKHMAERTQPTSLALARIEQSVRAELRRCGFEGAFDITVEVSPFDFDRIDDVDSEFFDDNLGVRRCAALGVQIIERDEPR